MHSRGTAGPLTSTGAILLGLALCAHLDVRSAHALGSGDTRILKWNTWDLWWLQQASMTEHSIVIGRDIAGHHTQEYGAGRCSNSTGTAAECVGSLQAALESLQLDLKAAGKACAATSINCTLWAHPLKPSPSWQEILVDSGCTHPGDPRTMCRLALGAIMRAWLEACALVLSHGSATALRGIASKQGRDWKNVLEVWEN